MNSPIPETMAATHLSESLSSNPESPLSPLKSETESMISAQDVDFNSKAYANELLEHGLTEERFRIDRKKLEDMLQIQRNSDESVENADVFFQRVTLETSTLISWPSKLKIGAKSKKDPHVKIVGKPEAVQQAKQKILEILDTKKNRVTLKMDVSHSDHSYIIGKGGFKIQQVMEETGCHIHFPDSNKPKPKPKSIPPFRSSLPDFTRSSCSEKSNQVSIAGQAAGVELARSKIRELLPLVFMFELPNGQTRKPGDECSPAISHIQQTYSFNVTFRSVGPPGMGRTLLTVRGSQRLLSRVRQGLCLLMEYLTGSQTVPVMGFMKTEIAAQHHQFVMGACNINTQMIMNKTGATIIFPDSSTFDPDSPSVLAGLASKSTVIIHGSFDSVCMAWQELLKCLPLVLMFDLKEGQELDPVMVNNFMEAHNINIMVKPKMKENTKSVVVSGAEKDCKVLFQVRKEILGLEEDDSVPTSPRHETFQFPSNEKMLVGKDQIPKSHQNLSTAESLSLLSNIIQQNPQIVGLLSNLSSAFPVVNPPDAMPQLSLPNPAFRNTFQNHINQIPMSQYTAKRDVENWINHHERGYAMSNGANFQRNLKADDGDSGIYIHPRNRFQHVLESRSYASSRPESSASSTSSNDTPDYKTNAFLKKISQTNESIASADIHELLSEYGNKKLSANKAMQQPIGEGVRTPNHLWSGYCFSKSMPDFAARAKRAAQSSGSISEFLDMDNSKSTVSSKGWPSDLIEKEDSPVDQGSPFGFSNFWENVPHQPPINYGAIKSLDQLLNLLDLQKYSDVLNEHEIDLVTFLTLSDLDLQQLGISYGARRKMLAAIGAIGEHRLGDWSLKNFRAAPGAERRTFISRYASGPLLSEENIDRM